MQKWRVRAVNDVLGNGEGERETGGGNKQRRRIVAPYVCRMHTTAVSTRAETESRWGKGYLGIFVPQMGRKKPPDLIFVHGDHGVTWGEIMHRLQRSRI